MNDNAIVVQGLHKSFGDVHAVKGIDLEVERATVYGLLGPNGAGKTTTVRVLTTILHPDQGSASVLGLDVVDDAQAVRERIGLAGQYAAIDEHLTGRENLRLAGNLSHLPKALTRQRAGDLLERFGLADAADRPANTYSGGMRRRLDLAAALVHRPPVLFLDEPTTGLDPASRKDLWGVIDELVADGTTVLLTTQYLEEADRLAKRLAVIDLGVVIAEGTPQELKARMGGTVIDVGFADHETATNAAIVVRSAPELDAQDEDIRVDGSMIELAVDDGPKTAIVLLRTLDANSLTPTTLAVREPSLDDVFLTLTGHKAEDGADHANLAERGAA
ncbi:MAG: ATP-binding cassette domain-containing protein [Actinobacteria bacterium]|nr:ATP-binding cassette domain-containing protein [Actinomycetota bacterium]